MCRYRTSDIARKHVEKVVTGVGASKVEGYVLPSASLYIISTSRKTTLPGIRLYL
jgi:hypothetical protein